MASLIITQIKGGFRWAGSCNNKDSIWKSSFLQIIWIICKEEGPAIHFLQIIGFFRWAKQLQKVWSRSKALQEDLDYPDRLVSWKEDSQVSQSLLQIIWSPWVDWPAACSEKRVWQSYCWQWYAFLDRPTSCKEDKSIKNGINCWQQENIFYVFSSGVYAIF